MPLQSLKFKPGAIMHLKFEPDGELEITLDNGMHLRAGRVLFIGTDQSGNHFRIDMEQFEPRLKLGA